MRTHFKNDIQVKKRTTPYAIKLQLSALLESSGVGALKSEAHSKARHRRPKL
jgi:hypothetical protein